jgi:hypothetical protein
MALQLPETKEVIFREKWVLKWIGKMKFPIFAARNGKFLLSSVG